ncbi:hypothetical protein ACFVXE_08020 [Streptomyces sp. NPDC058231]|uniref:hypothetical protein n=1 Tax=Streptomyces sp. NPDC058231 TaxID=3346392 RepID=UPI0036EFA024
MPGEKPAPGATGSPAPGDEDQAEPTGVAPTWRAGDIRPRRTPRQAAVGPEHNEADG